MCIPPNGFLLCGCQVFSIIVVCIPDKTDPWDVQFIVKLVIFLVTVTCFELPDLIGDNLGRI
jgi:hypothetical protein